MKNIDFLAAQYGQEIGSLEDKDKISTAVNDSLDILHRQGLYAMFLWLHEQNKEQRREIGEKLQLLLRHRDFPYQLGAERDCDVFNIRNPIAALNNVRELLTGELLKMFIIKEIISKVLCYARHTLKARQDNPAPQNQNH